jgi:cobalt/nickel transport system permease protein
LVICIASDYYPVSILIAMAMIGCTIYLGKINVQTYLRILVIPFTFILISGIVLLVELSKVKLGYLDIPLFGGYCSITKTSIHSTVSVSVKALCSVTCLYMISLSTPLYEIIGVLKRCKVPEIIIELMYLMYRFIFLLLETYHNMKVSAQSRLGYITLRRSYQSFFGICTNLFVIAYNKASKSFDAMEARGYDGAITFIEKKKPVSKKHIVIVGFYFIMLFTVLALKKV